MLEFLKTYWYFIVAALLVIVVVVFWAIEIHNSKKTKSNVEELELENQELDEKLEDQTTESETKEEPKKDNNDELKSEKESKKTTKKTKSQSEQQPKEKLEENQKEENKEEPKEEKISKTSTKAKYSVSYDKDKKDWVVKKAGSERATKRCKTKKEAMETIEKLSSHNEINISVKKKDGKFQKLDNAKKSTAKKN